MQPLLLSPLAIAALSLLPLAPEPVARPAVAVQDAAAEAARLLPADAVLVLRLESVEALLGVVNRLAVAAGSEATSPERMLTGLELPGDAGQVDSSRPLWMAVSVSAQMPSPQLTFVVPARDATAYAGSIQDAGGWTGVVAGSYVGTSQTQGYAAAEGPSPLAAALRPGLLSMHLDLEALITAFRPFIEMGLDQAEMQLDTLADMSAGPMDIGPLLELYLDMAWDFVDSAEALDVTLVQQGALVELSGWLATLEKSPMAAWGEGAPVDLRGWPAQVDTGATLSMAMGGDWSALMKRMQPMLDVSFAMYPAGTQEFFTEYMAASEPLFGLMGPVFAGGDLGEGGMRMSYVVRSEEPAELFAGLSAVAQRFEGREQPLGIAITATETVEIGGVQARRFRMDIDYDVLAAAMGEELGEAEQAQMRDAMAALYGEGGLTFTMAPTATALAMAFGGDEAFAQRTLTAPSGAARDLPADLQRALTAAGGGSLGLVYRFDFGKLMEEVGQLAQAFGQQDMNLQGLPTSPLPVTLWTGIRERTWSGGASLDLEALAAFIQAAREAQAAGADEAEQAYEFDVFGSEEMDSRTAVVQAEMALIEAGLELYSLNNGGRYPDSLEVLVMLDENGESYLDELPVDPWGNPYVYTTPQSEGDGYHLTCYGSDGAPGGEGDAADIVVHLRS